MEELLNDKSSQLNRKDQGRTNLQSKQQRRLSKPNVSGKSMADSSIAAPVFTIRRKSVPTRTLPSPYDHGSQSHDAGKSGTFVLSSNEEADKVIEKPSKVALLVSKIEGNTPVPSTSQLSPTMLTKSRISLSSLLSSGSSAAMHNASLSTLASREKLGENRELNSVSPSSSQIHLDSDPIPPPRKAASFTPGVATRKASPSQLPTDKLPESETSTATSTKSMKSSQIEDLIDTESSWESSSQIVRAETPNNLDYSHLGKLSLGSLHIVNGSASPAFSDMSRQLKSQLEPRVRRDISSIYPDSDKDQWEDADLPSSPKSEHTLALETPKGEDRHFSFAVGAESQLSVLPRDDAASTTTYSTQDKTSQMAEEYMAELPASPYQGSPASSSGSVMRHKQKIHSPRSFVDETLDLPEDRPETAASYYSARQNSAQEERFSSALEIQAPASPTQERLDERNANRVKRPRLSDISSTAKSDSGYSSNTSLNAATKGVFKKIDGNPDLSSEIPRAFGKSSFKLAFKKNGPKYSKGILVKPSPAKSVHGQIEGPATSALSLVALPYASAANELRAQVLSTPSSPEKSGKLRKRLQKARRKSMVETSKEIVVQRMSSISSFEHLPEINAVVRAKLAERVEALPELEETFKTDQHIKHQASASVLDLSLTETMRGDFRFPSPAPEEEKRRSRSRSRPRLPIRPKSWFGWGTEEKKDHRKSQSVIDAANAKATLDSFGSVIDALGTNPYDIAISRNPSSSNAEAPRRNTSPYAISSQFRRPRSMMDDDTAVKISKMRSKYAAERNDGRSQRNSFDDRGGIPGRYVFPADVTTEVPPVPPMPDQQEIERRFSHRFNINESPASSTRADRWYLENESNFEQDSSPGPPPPPHSPRPHFVSEDDQDLGNETPPPPPCHSPMPQDVVLQSSYGSIQSNLQNSTPFDDDQWAAQSHAWKTRRESAGKLLRRSWDIEESHHFDANREHSQNEYSMLPSIPQKNNAWVSQPGYYDDDHKYGAIDLYRRLPPRPQRRDQHWTNIEPRAFPIKSHSYHEMPPAHRLSGAHNLTDSSYDLHWQQHHHQSAYQQSCNSSMHSRPHSSGWEIYDETPCHHHVPLPEQHHKHIVFSGSHSLANSRYSERSDNGASSRVQSRPHSRQSTAASLAEELHPESPPRRSPAPDFGRYSGGLEFGYEGRARGFGGSTGTRSVSGKADAQRKSVGDGMMYGVDFSDVPAMTVSVGAMPGGGMRYGAWYDGERRRHDG